MLTTDELTAMRSTVAETLVDTCTIAADDGSTTFDPDTGEYVTTPGSQVYAGACRLAPVAGERVVLVGEQAVSLRTFTLRLPWNSTGVEVNHVATVTTDDAELTGDTFRVIDVPGGSERLSRDLVVERIQ